MRQRERRGGAALLLPGCVIQVLLETRRVVRWSGWGGRSMIGRDDCPAVSFHTQQRSTRGGELILNSVE